MPFFIPTPPRVPFAIFIPHPLDYSHTGNNTILSSADYSLYFWHATNLKTEPC